MTLRTFRFPFALWRIWLSICVTVWAVPALAQFRVDIAGVGLTQWPIAVVPFRGDDAAPQKMGAIVQADLERSEIGRASCRERV